MVEQGQRCSGSFFGRRVNCEQVPLLPASVVARMWDDPRRIPYLLVWTPGRDGTVQEAARIAPHCEGRYLIELDCTGAVEVKRHDGTRNFIRTVLRPMPRNGGRVRLLICPYCSVPRRGLYAWEPGGPYTTSVVRSNWGCRKCNRLRYESEGGALVIRGRGAFFRMLDDAYGGFSAPRSESWLPYVFTSIDDPRLDGIVRRIAS